MNKPIILILLVLSIPFTLALEIGIGSPSLVPGISLEGSAEPTNFSMQNVNSSEFWDNLNTPGDIATGDITSFNSSYDSFIQFFNGTFNESYASFITGFNGTFNSTYDGYGGDFVNITGDTMTGLLTLTAELLLTIPGAVGVWQTFSAVGSAIPVGVIQVVGGEFFIQATGILNPPINFANRDLTGLFTVRGDGMAIARSLTTVRAENGSIATFETNTTSSQSYVDFFTDIIGSFSYEVKQIRTQNLTTQDINVSGEWESGFHSQAHCAESKFGAGQIFIPCGEFATQDEGIVMLQNGSVIGYSTSVKSVAVTGIDVNVLLENNGTVYINHTSNILTANQLILIQTTIPRGTHKFQKGDSLVCSKSASASIIGSVTCEFAFVYDSNIKILNDIIAGGGEG